MLVAKKLVMLVLTTADFAQAAIPTNPACSSPNPLRLPVKIRKLPSELSGKLSGFNGSSWLDTDAITFRLFSDSLARTATASRYQLFSRMAEL